MSEDEKNLVYWFLENEKKVYDTTINFILENYSKIKESYKESYSFIDRIKYFPRLKKQKDVEKHISLTSINIHQISHNSIPFIGLELECPWDQEHGIGIILIGDKPLEIGGADTAILLWIAEKYLEELNGN